MSTKLSNVIFIFMDSVYTFLENRLSKFLTHKKAVKEAAKTQKKTFWGEVWSWVDALIFAIIVVILLNQYIFQLFVIPSPSMVHTLEVKDRVIVNKASYGIELYPGGLKINDSSRPVERDQIITFYNPEYESKGPVFDVLAQMIYMGTFTLVNIDKNADGTMAERLFVKRSIGLPGETFNFVDGNVILRKAGTGTYQDEESFRAENELVEGPHRSVDAELYPVIKAWGALYAYQEKGIKNAPSYYLEEYEKNTANYPADMYAFDQSRLLSHNNIDPTDMTTRSELGKYQAGIYVPEGRVLPLGDNRDNSRDGRYFGPVLQKKVNGHVIGRFWPLNRITGLSHK